MTVENLPVYRHFQLKDLSVYRLFLFVGLPADSLPAQHFIGANSELVRILQLQSKFSEWHEGVKSSRVERERGSRLRVPFCGYNKDAEAKEAAVPAM